MANTYVTKPVKVQAMQFDGKPANGYAILSWLYSVGCSGSYESGYESQGPDRLVIGDQHAVPQQWIVVPDNSPTAVVMNQKDFVRVYEQAGDSPRGRLD